VNLKHLDGTILKFDQFYLINYLNNILFFKNYSRIYFYFYFKNYENLINLNMINKDTTNVITFKRFEFNLQSLITKLQQDTNLLRTKSGMFFFKNFSFENFSFLNTNLKEFYTISRNIRNELNVSK